MGNSMPRVVGLTGKLGSGKSTVAALLRMLGYREIAFGDALRDEVDKALKREDESYCVLIEDKATCVAIHQLIVACRAAKMSPYDKPTPDLMRKLLQLWGTEYRRVQDKDYWVNKVEKAIARPGLWAISDVRFPNEVALVHKYQAPVIRVVRPSAESMPSMHASEDQEYEVDQVIVNDGLIGNLADTVLRVVRS